MKTITLEGKEVQISDESFEVLKKSLVEENYERKRVEYSNTYYFLDHKLCVHNTSECGDYKDQEMFNAGNYYYTEYEAIKARERQLALLRLHDAFRKDYYFEPDWSDDVNEKYFIIFKCINNKFESDSYNFNDTKSQTELPYFKSHQDVKSFIKENEDDLKIVFGVEK